MLLRKMLRDMRIHKTQFISIFIMTLLAVFIYAGVSSEWYGLQNVIDKYYIDNNLANAWIYSTGFDTDTVRAIENIDDVTGVERRLTVESIADLDKNPTVQLHFVEDNKISKFKLLKGEEFSAQKDGIWLDSLFAKARKLGLGDSIKVSVNGMTIEKEIKGLIMSPEYVYFVGKNDLMPVRDKYGYGYLSAAAFPKEVPITYTELMVTTDKLSDKQLEKAIDKATNGKYSVFLPRKNLRSYSMFREEIKEHKAIGEVFPIAFLAVAMLTIVTTMARLVNNQRTQIGILKAIGFKKRKILFHYISYGLWISLSGTIIGTVLGPLTLPYLFYGPMQMAYTIPQWSSKTPVNVIYMGVISVVCCTLITYLSCRNVLKDTPSESLRPKAPKAVKHSFFDRLKIWKYFNFYSQWNLRDIIRCKGRSIMAIIGILGCTALLICAFSMQDTFDFIIDWNFNKINQYESKLMLEENIKEDKVDRILDNYGGELLSESAVELKSDSEKRSGELQVMDHVTLIQSVDVNCNEMKLPNDQIAMSYKMAKVLQVKEGDEISWHIYGEEKWNTSKIGSIYRTPLSQGIIMPREIYEDYGYTFHPTAVVSNKNLSEIISNPEKEGITKILTKKEMIDGYQSMTEAMDVMVYVLMIAAAVLAVVVIYNLGVLSYTERQRELSTLKVLGFKTRNLRKLLLIQNIWLTVIGIILGIPIGIGMLGYIFRYMGEELDFFIVVSLSTYIYAATGTMLLSILVNRLFSIRVKGIDLVSSLKGVE